MRSPRLTATLGATLVLLAALGSSAQASSVATFTTAFQPNRLGQPTSLIVNMKIADSAGGIPTPLANAVVRLPAGMGIDTTGVGTCARTTLQSRGPSACPANALVGVGSATLQVSLGGTLVSEVASVTPFLGPPQNGRVVLLLYGNGTTPVSAQLTIQGVMQPDTAPFGQQLVMPIPTIATIPGAPNASVISLRLTIGANNIAYYRTVTVTKKVRRHGRIVRVKVKQRKLFHVRGIVVPRKCPAGGAFPFSLVLTFEDGSTTTTNATAPCPA